MAYNTQNPVPSSDPRDLFDNSNVIDSLLNSGLTQVPGRFGQMLYTQAFFQQLAQSGQARVDDIVGDVDRYAVQSKSDMGAVVADVGTTASNAKADMLKTAAELGADLNNKRYSSYAGEKGMLSDPQSRDNVVGIVDGDPDANLNGWYSWNNTTKKWVRFLDQPAMRSVVDYRVADLGARDSRMIPLIINGMQVLLWVENGRINGSGLQATILEAVKKVIPSANYSAALIPLIFNESGQVIAWLKNGRFEAAGLQASISEAISAGLANYQPKQPVKVTDGSSISAYRAKIANALGGSGSARVIFTGDSWAEHLFETAQPLSQALYAAYGQAGQGWIGLDADEGGATSTKSQLLNGARLVKSGFALLDMSATDCNSLDGHAASATNTASTIKITNLKTQSLTWYYKDGDGTFRYSVDGAEPVVVTGGNTGARKALEISGLSDTTHSITFDLVGNTGTVTMYGGMALRSATGVEFSKAGNGGSTAVQWQGIAPFVQAYAAELKPDLAIIILGSNDRNQNITKAAFKAGVQALVNAYRTGSPTCSVILITPTRGQTTSDLGLLADYSDAMIEIAQATANVEFLNLNAFMPPRTISDAQGMWADSLHLSEAGGRFVTGLLMKYFLRTN